MNDAVYAVSHWHHCENAGGFPDTNPRNAWYHANAMTKADDRHGQARTTRAATTTSRPTAPRP